MDLSSIKLYNSLLISFCAHDPQYLHWQWIQPLILLWSNFSPHVWQKVAALVCTEKESSRITPKLFILGTHTNSNLLGVGFLIPKLHDSGMGPTSSMNSISFDPDVAIQPWLAKTSPRHLGWNPSGHLSTDKCAGNNKHTFAIWWAIRFQSMFRHSPLCSKCFSLFIHVEIQSRNLLLTLVSQILLEKMQAKYENTSFWISSIRKSSDTECENYHGWQEETSMGTTGVEQVGRAWSRRNQDKMILDL